MAQKHKTTAAATKRRKAARKGQKPRAGSGIPRGIPKGWVSQ